MFPGVLARQKNPPPTRLAPKLKIPSGAKFRIANESLLTHPESQDGRRRNQEFQSLFFSLGFLYQFYIQSEVFEACVSYPLTGAGLGDLKNPPPTARPPNPLAPELQTPTGRPKIKSCLDLLPPHFESLMSPY